jgi:acetyl-CoA carboxylase carboxyltransferase component
VSTGLAPTPAASATGADLSEVRRLMLGYDFDPREVERQLATLPRGGAPAAAEEEILRTFADVAALFTGAAQVANLVRHSAEECLSTYLRDLDARGEGLPPSFLDKLRQALAHYGALTPADRSPELEESLFRIALSHRRRALQVPPVLTLLERLLDRGDPDGLGEVGDADDADGMGGPAGATGLRDLLDRMIAETQGREPAVYDLAREVRYRGFDRPLLLAVRDRVYAAADADLARLVQTADPDERAARIRALVDCTQPLHRRLSQRFDAGASRAEGGPALRQAILEVMLRRYYRIHPLGDVQVFEAAGRSFVRGDYEHQVPVRVLATHAEHADLAAALAAVGREVLRRPKDDREVAVDLYLWSSHLPAAAAAVPDAVAAELAARLALPGFPAGLRRVAVSLSDPAGVEHFTFRPTGSGYAEDRLQRGLHPMMAQRLELWRLGNFRLGRLPSPEGVYLFHGVAEGNPRDERLFALAEVRDFTPVRDAAGRVVQLPELEHMLMESLAGIRRFQARRPAGERLQWNRVLLYAWPPVDLLPAELLGLVHRMSPLAHGLGLEKVAVRCRIPDREGGALRELVLEISNPGEGEMSLRFRKPSAAPLKPLREYAQKVVELRRRGLVYPYEVIKRLAPPRQEAQADLPAGEFAEHDLADSGEGTGRLVPVDRPYGGNRAGVVAGVIRNYTGRYPEGMARVLLLADPSRGMGALGEPECRRVLAALDLAAEMGVPVDWFAVSGGTGGPDERAARDWTARVLRRIVGFTRAGGEINLVVHGLNAGAQPFWNAAATTLMHTRGILVLTPEGAMVLADADTAAERSEGPSGPAQYFARDLGQACRLLLAHHEHTYRAPGERFPRPAPTRDPRERDVRPFPHGGELATVGEVWAANGKPAAERPFEIRSVMAAVADQDHPPLERWYGMRDAETAVVWEAHLGGHPVCLLGFESKPLPRLGAIPPDGPDGWTGGTLFPRAAKKVARALGAASGNRPVVVLADLGEVDGSPESLRAGQLEYAAEIARAVVEFEGPIVLVVLDRCHEAAGLIFSPALNDCLEMAAITGSAGSEAHLTLPPERLRPYLIEAVERGMAKELSRRAE